MVQHILGDFRSQPHCGLSEGYFRERDCWLDCREPDMLHISPEANIGWEVILITQSHDVNPGCFGRLVGRKIIIHKNAFIAGFVLLYNCEIGEGAVVAAGSVVRSQKVEPWTMVAGNPAVPIKRYDWNLKKWVPIPQGIQVNATVSGSYDAGQIGRDMGTPP